ncbi:hypothetical protein [Halorussus sp. AFM4]|uniref:hypothetical protein n=1 Tax=Halorussus sp. AFM4 TaxID=3421651 RepID=UPI003EBBB0C0
MIDKENPLIVALSDLLPVKSYSKTREICKKMDWKPFLVRLGHVGQVLMAFSLLLLVIILLLQPLVTATELLAIANSFMSLVVFGVIALLLVSWFSKGAIETIASDENLSEVSASTKTQRVATGVSAALLFLFSIVLRVSISKLPEIEWSSGTATLIGNLIGYFMLDALYFGSLLLASSTIALLHMETDIPSKPN